jgi:hypothetical protein
MFVSPAEIFRFRVECLVNVQTFLMFLGSQFFFIDWLGFAVFLIPVRREMLFFYAHDKPTNSLRRNLLPPHRTCRIKRAETQMSLQMPSEVSVHVSILDIEPDGPEIPDKLFQRVRPSNK